MPQSKGKGKKGKCKRKGKGKSVGGSQEGRKLEAPAAGAAAGKAPSNELIFYQKIKKREKCHLDLTRKLGAITFRRSQINKYYAMHTPSLWPLARLPNGQRVFVPVIGDAIRSYRRELNVNLC